MSAALGRPICNNRFFPLGAGVRRMRAAYQISFLFYSPFAHRIVSSPRYTAVPGLGKFITCLRARIASNRKFFVLIRASAARRCLPSRICQPSSSSLSARVRALALQIPQYGRTVVGRSLASSILLPPPLFLRHRSSGRIAATGQICHDRISLPPVYP